MKAGDIIFIADVYEVHPGDTKQSTGRIKKFTVTVDVSDTAGAITMTISLQCTGGAYQNVTARAGDNKAITVLGTSGNGLWSNIAFIKMRLLFVTADLEVPNGVD